MARLAWRRAASRAAVLRPKEVGTQLAVSASTLRVWSTESRTTSVRAARGRPGAVPDTTTAPAATRFAIALFQRYDRPAIQQRTISLESPNSGEMGQKCRNRCRMPGGTGGEHVTKQHLANA